MSHLRVPEDPYTEEARSEHEAAAFTEYTALVKKKKAFDDRVQKGVGVDWNQLIHISK